MKNLFKYAFLLAIVFVGAVSISSCGSDKDGGDEIPSGLVGTWRGTSGRWSSTVTFYSNGSISERLTGTASVSVFTGKYTVSGSTVTAKGTNVRTFSDGEVETGSLEFSYTYSGNKLVGGHYGGMEFTKN